MNVPMVEYQFQLVPVDGEPVEDGWLDEVPRVVSGMKVMLRQRVISDFSEPVPYIEGAPLNAGAVAQ